MEVYMAGAFLVGGDLVGRDGETDVAGRGRGGRCPDGEPDATSAGRHDGRVSRWEAEPSSDVAGGAGGRAGRIADRAQLAHRIDDHRGPPLGVGPTDGVRAYSSVDDADRPMQESFRRQQRAAVPSTRGRVADPTRPDALGS